MFCSRSCLRLGSAASEVGTCGLERRVEVAALLAGRRGAEFGDEAEAGAAARAVPLSWLLDRSRVASAAREPRLSGTAPDSWLLLTHKPVSAGGFVRLPSMPKEDGIVP